MVWVPFNISVPAGGTMPLEGAVLTQNIVGISNKNGDNRLISLAEGPFIFLSKNIDLFFFLGGGVFEEDLVIRLIFQFHGGGDDCARYQVLG